MSVPKLSFEETLLEKVVLKENCMGCGACVIVCPFGCLEYLEQKPKLVKNCEVCGICPRVCPRYEWSRSDLEKLVFGRERKPNEDFGVYQRLVLAQTTDKDVMLSCQDGGVVTTLVTFALKNGIIDGALLSGLNKDKPFYPAPVLATTPKEVLKCSGTRYTYSPNLLAIQEAFKQKRQGLAFVGTPCQIQAIRKMEAAKLRRYTGRIKFTVGLMCTESFTYRGLMEEQIQQTLGINLHDVDKMNIKGRVNVTTNSGDVKTISLAEAKQHTRKSCLPCTDFSAELADISAGGLGLSGWTLTIIRTEIGEELFKDAEKAGLIKTRSIEKEKNAFNLLIKLSRKKRKTADSS
ncbi:MAG: Coenzyme F420 hydrogenase/dehydrogenase, beta subunit C-terminal domain [Candidatus Bathyarchaeota archaeon]|nr:Coenzyme F420 hydrogenase/dehydrogenase, beta subunit C-terminal domain [Candidatus Bathyarchaeota archaeon]